MAFLVEDYIATTRAGIVVVSQDHHIKLLWLKARNMVINCCPFCVRQGCLEAPMFSLQCIEQMNFISTLPLGLG